MEIFYCIMKFELIIYQRDFFFFVGRLILFRKFFFDFRMFVFILICIFILFFVFDIKLKVIFILRKLFVFIDDIFLLSRRNILYYIVLDLFYKKRYLVLDRLKYRYVFIDFYIIVLFD